MFAVLALDGGARGSKQKRKDGFAARAGAFWIMRRSEADV
jgi:hypothetical protein